VFVSDVARQRAVIASGAPVLCRPRLLASGEVGTLTIKTQLKR